MFWAFLFLTPSSAAVSVGQVMKTYHMYHTESISAESKLKDAEKQEEKQFSKSGDLNVNLLRHDDRQPRRGFVRKIEKMKEKVRPGAGVHSPLALVGIGGKVEVPEYRLLGTEPANGCICRIYWSERRRWRRRLRRLSQPYCGLSAIAALSKRPNSQTGSTLISQRREPGRL